MASVTAINSVGASAHNPRGNLWFNDDTAFGHKLLMKMGWQKGKGLGKNEDGIKENLKVKLRSTNSGLGFKDDAYTNVMKTEYESILKNLKPQRSSQETPNPSDESEKPPKPKVLKNRLRYPKLFFGKDVTKYSEKDMKSIFICSQQIGKTEEKEDCKVTPQQTESENSLSKSGEIIKSDLSISEYFAMKMKEKKGNALNKSVAAHSDQETSFELNKSKTENLTNNENQSCKRKRKNLEMSAEEEYTNELNSHSSVMQCEDIKIANLVEFSVKNPSKKRKKNSKINSKFDEVKFYPNENEHKSFDKSNQNLLADSLTDFPGSSNIRNETQRECSIANTTEMICENIDNGELPVSSKKKKKKKRHSSPTVVEHSLQNLNFEEEKHIENSKTVNDSSFSKSIDDELLNGNTSSLKKKKKQKKKLKQKLRSCLKSKRDSYSIKNVYFNENVSYRIIDSDIDSVEGLARDKSVDPIQIFSYVDNTTSVSESPIDAATFNECTHVNSTPHDDKILVKEDTSNKYDDATNNDSTSMNDVKSDEINLNTDSSNDLQNVSAETSNELSYLTSLPSSKSPHFNFWIESQRQALKISIYKKMLKNIKTHDVLRTTNLLSIKGYGNWGF